MKLNKIFILMLFGASQLLAQDIGTTKVKVVEGFRPTVPEATRLNEKAAFADTIKKDRTQEYAVVETDLKSNYKTRPLKSAKVKADKIKQLYGSKVGLGLGSAWTTKASVLHSSKRSKTLSCGILLNHFANKYDVSNSKYKSSGNNMHLYGKKISPLHIFTINLEYDRRTALYSSEVDLPQILNNSNKEDYEKKYRNRFAYTKLSFSAVSKELAADKLKYNTTFFVSDLNELSENQIKLSANLSKTINGLPFSINIELDDYLNYNNPDSKFKSTNVKLFRFYPSVSMTGYGFDFDLGFKFQYFSDGSSFVVFPQIKVVKELVKDVLLLYGGLRHGAQRHTFKSLSDENPYIHSYGTNQTILSGNPILQNLKITDKDELYFSIKNLLSEDEVFEGSIAFGIIQNFAHFVDYNNLIYNRFVVEYTDVKQLHLNINYFRKINKIMDLIVNSNYYNWDMEVYHKPNLTCDVRSPFNLRDKIKVVPSLSYIGKRKSISSFDLESASDLNEINQNLPAQIHMNLAVYYNYKKNISAYFHLNNLTNSKQDVWKGYREVGFNSIFGLNYSF